MQIHSVNFATIESNNMEIKFCSWVIEIFRTERFNYILWLKIDGITGEKITASQVLYKSIRVAECLQQYGIKAGDCVGICSENRFEIPYVMFAVFFIGATYAPFNPTYSERKTISIKLIFILKLLSL